MVVNRFKTMGNRAGGGAKAPNGGTVGRGGFAGFTKPQFPGAAKVSQLAVGTKIEVTDVNGNSMKKTGTVTKVEKYGSTRIGVTIDYGKNLGTATTVTRPNRYVNGKIVK